MTKEEHIERLSQWLENWLLPTLSGNEAVGLRQQIAEAREAAQHSVQRTAPKRASVCTCSLDDGIHEWNCALNTAHR